MPTSVRFASRNDADKAFGVWRDSVTERRGTPPTKRSERRVRDRLLQEDDGLFLVATDEAGQVVGMTWGTGARADGGAGDVVPGVFHLSLMFVHPRRWSEGIGSDLLDAVLNEMSSRGFTTVEAWTHESNERAQRLYARKSFIATDDLRADDDGHPMRRWIWSAAN